MIFSLFAHPFSSHDHTLDLVNTSSQILRSNISLEQYLSNWQNIAPPADIQLHWEAFWLTQLEGEALLLAQSRQRPGVLLNSTYYTAHELSPTDNHPAQKPVVLRLRNTSVKPLHLLSAFLSVNFFIRFINSPGLNFLTSYHFFSHRHLSSCTNTPLRVDNHALVK